MQYVYQASSTKLKITWHPISKSSSDDYTYDTSSVRSPTWKDLPSVIAGQQWTKAKAVGWMLYVQIGSSLYSVDMDVLAGELSATTLCTDAIDVLFGNDTAIVKTGSGSTWQF